MSASPFSKMAAKKDGGVTYNQEFKSVIITVLLFVTVSGNAGAGVECSANCSCSALDSYVNSRAVKCSYLDLSYIPAMLHMDTVHTLDISSNKLIILRNASFSNYSRLSTLILSYNDVTDIEINAFAGLQMMRDIDLTYNKLETFYSEIFSSNLELENVSLKGNSLKYISSDSPILISASISSLDLSSCSLTAIYSVTFSRLPSLYSLDLSSNLLQTISVSTFEKLPDLRILELNNNRWTCNCDVIEVMQWATARRGQQPAHKPVKCLEKQQYRKLWTTAGGRKPCSESKTTEALLTREREYITDTTVDTISQRFVTTAVTSVAEIGAQQESEARGWASLLTWNFNTLMVFGILPITLGVAVFVALIAMNYITKRFRRPQHEIQGKDKHLSNLFFDVPLLDPQLTADLRKQHCVYVSRSSDGVRYADYHVYERIE